MADAQGGSSPGAGAGAQGRAPGLLWADSWTRAVVVPAWRRAGAIWVGCALVAAVIFGPTGMQPSDLTGLALHNPGVMGVLAATWLLVYAPTARVIVRADAAAYLRSLPGPALVPALIGGGAFVALQLPWLMLWVLGAGLEGLAVVAAHSLAILALARWRPPPGRAGWPSWKHSGAALRGVHLRALRRRAGDALVRGTGLALLAGGAAGLFVRNNQLTGVDAAVLGASVIAILLVPACVGVLLVILGAHRETAWLAEALGVSRATRITSLAFAITVVQLAASVLALVAAELVLEAPLSTLVPLAGLSVAVAVGSALGCARFVLHREASPTVAANVVMGTIVVAAAAVLCLGLFGPLGALGFGAAALLALLTVPA